MTISSITVISDRISYEKKENGIAVFVKPSGRLDAIPIRTVETKRRLEMGAKNYLGTYYGSAGARDFQENLLNLKTQVNG